MNSYTETVRYLYALQYRGIKLGLRNIKALLHAVGNPEKRFASIHIAGTNGKGSTAAFIASIFREAGYATGLYTSPHLVHFTERIRINGIQIPAARVVQYVSAMRTTIEKVRATFFEATTCVAFQYFADEGVDLAIIEVGLGGRLDATNVLAPIVSVISPVSHDHTEYLGKTLKAIAREKGGIIKRRVPCVTACTEPDVLQTLRAIAKRKQTSLYQSRDLVQCREHEGKSRFVKFMGSGIKIPRVHLGLRGSHQTENARLAVASTAIALRYQKLLPRSLPIENETIKRGLHNVARNTGLRGRFEVIGKHYILDVAHNPAGVSALVESIEHELNKKCVVVFGVMRDKEFHHMLDRLAKIARLIIAVKPRTDRALNASEVCSYLRSRGASCLQGGSVRRGIRKAEEIRKGSGDPILVTGSHYVVGEALQYLHAKKLDK